MARAKKPRKPGQKKASPKVAAPYPAYVTANPHLKSIFDRIRAGRPCRMSEFTHFIAPLVCGFEAAAASGRVAKADRHGLPAQKPSIFTPPIP